MAQYATYLMGTQYFPADLMAREADLITPGVVSAGDLQVSTQSGMTVKVNGAAQGQVGGNAWLPQGYRFQNDAPHNVTLQAANATNPRIDLIVARIDTTQSPYAPVIVAITGTAAASPVAPTIPGTLIGIILARVTVPAAASSIVAGNITDTRTIAGLTDLVAHKADYTLQVPYAGVTTGTANTYAIATPNIIELMVGMAVSVKINVDSTGASTLNWNGKGAKGIKKANGADVTNLKATGIYTLRYDGINFILQGEGASGNAVASDLLSGKTASTDAGEIIGSMPNRGAVTITPKTTNQVITAGYHNGSGYVAGDADLAAPNILKNINIFGVVGTASAVKTIQRGVTYLSSGAVYNTTINAVTVANTFVNISQGFSHPSTYAVLTSPTNLQLKNTGYNSNFAWEVIELNPKIIKSVQKGEQLVNHSATVDVLLSSVNLTKTFIIINGSLLIYSSSYVGTYATLLDSTHLRLVNSAGMELTFYWQVIEFL